MRPYPDATPLALTPKDWNRLVMTAVLRLYELREELTLCQLEIDETTLIVHAPVIAVDKLIRLSPKIARAFQLCYGGDMVSIYCAGEWIFDYSLEIARYSEEEEVMVTVAERLEGVASTQEQEVQEARDWRAIAAVMNVDQQQVWGAMKLLGIGTLGTQAGEVAIPADQARELIVYLEEETIKAKAEEKFNQLFSSSVDVDFDAPNTTVAPVETEPTQNNGHRTEKAPRFTTKGVKRGMGYLKTLENAITAQKKSKQDSCRKALAELTASGRELIRTLASDLYDGDATKEAGLIKAAPQLAPPLPQPEIMAED